MNLFRRKPLPAIFALPAILALGFTVAAGSALAVPVSYTGTNVLIDYDTDTSGGDSVSTAGDSVTLNFGSNFNVSASPSPGTSNSVAEAFGSYSANFAFSARPGRVISGYQVTFAGTYSIGSPGSVSISGTPGFSTDNGSGSWGWTTTFDGASFPGLAGLVQATAQGDGSEVPGPIIGYRQMVVEDQSRPVYGASTWEEIPGKIIGYELRQVPDSDPPEFYEVPVYGPPTLVEIRSIIGYWDKSVDDHENPIYGPPTIYQLYLGQADIGISGILIEALTVPEPSTYALMGLGLAALAWTVRRRNAG